MSGPDVLFLHPPGPKRRRYQLDSYCSQPQKGPFRWHPIDFVTLGSAWRESANVTVADLGAAVGLDVPNGHPDVVVGLIGAYGWRDHLDFWRRYLSGTRAPVYLSGDIARHDPEFVFEQLPGIAGIIPEFCLAPQPDDLANRATGPHHWVPGGDEKHRYGIPRPMAGFRSGVQDFRVWSHRYYGLPFVHTWPWASTFSQTGCPYFCDYCMVSSYPWCPRDPDEFAEELLQLKRGGARHLYVRDATFNTTAKHLENVLPALSRTGLAWNTFARIEGIDTVADELAAAGCRTLQFGIDSPDRDVLRQHKKYVRDTDIARMLAAVRAAGIESVGHFVHGFQPRESVLALVRYARDVGLDWITLTPLMNRPGTQMWDRHALGNGTTLEAPGSTRASVVAGQLYFYLRSPTLARLLTSYTRAWVRSQLHLLPLAEAAA